tara:strand:+ start:631 stop:1140 length:510 start_codon:yes stop_codon:yes gene_type:complete
MQWMARIFIGLSILVVIVGGGGYFYLTTQIYSHETEYAANDADIAIDGYDPVAYFTFNDAVKGDPLFEAEWKGIKWHFATVINRDLFAENPLKYAPQYGGYSAFNMIKGYSVQGDPKVWNIIDDKLYLNYSIEARDKWLQDVRYYISQADIAWPQVQTTLAARQRQRSQ